MEIIKSIFFLIKITLMISLGCSVITGAQEINFKTYDVEQGLSQNQVYSLLQDSRGFLWVGTQEGLNRFDGYGFKIFNHEPGIPASLSDYAVNDIAEDEFGFIWVATREGLNRFDPRTETFTHFFNDTTQSNSLSNNYVWRLYADKKGSLWIGTRGGLNKLDLINNNFEFFRIETGGEQSINHNIITAIFEARDGNLLIGTPAGLNFFDTAKKTFKTFKSDPSGNRLSSNYIRAINQDADNNLWIGTTKGLDVIDAKDQKIVKTYPIGTDQIAGSKIIQSLCFDNAGRLWIGTLGGGLIRFEPFKKSFLQIGFEAERDGIINSIIEDSFGVIWVGSNGGGIKKISKETERLRLITGSSHGKPGLSGKKVTSFFLDSSRLLWIGVEGEGINKIPIDKLLNGESSFSTLNYAGENKLKLNNIRYISEDDNGTLWFASFGNGLFSYQKNQNYFENFYYDPGDKNSLSNNYLHAIHKDKDGILWIGSGAGGLVRYDPLSKNFKSFKYNPSNPASLSSNEVTSIYEDKNGVLWLGTTTGGLNKFDPASESFIHYKHDVKDITSISSNRIEIIFEDSFNNLWIGTFGGGLNLFDRGKESFTFFMEKDGLPGNIINGIIEDENKNLWVSTNKGISKFNFQKKSFINFNINDGLQDNEFISKSCFIDPQSGYIFFGGINGFNFFHPDSLKGNQILPNILLTDIKLSNRSVPIGTFSDGSSSPLQMHISYTEQVTLSFSDDVISFEFSALHFTKPEKNQYAYMLEGFDADWISSGTRRFVTYTNLAPGEYIFRIRASNGDGLWNEDGPALSIVVTPPWWQSWWAYFLYAGIIVSILFGYRGFELNRVKLRNELELKHFEAQKLQEVDQLKSRFFANISHEFRTPLTVIIGLTDKLRENISNGSESDLKVMKTNAQRLLQLINQLLELSKIEAGSINIKAEKIDLIKFLKRIINSFSSYALQKKLQLTFNGRPADDPFLSEPLFIYFDPEMMETVFYNLLSNAIKFTPENQKISIEVFLEERSAKIKFTNTGVGIPREKISNVFDRFYQVDDSGTRSFEGTGIGLAIVKELVELHKGSIKVESSNNETTFIVSLAFGKEHFLPGELSQAHDDKEFGDEKISTINLDILSTDSSSEKILKGKLGKTNSSDSEIILVVEDNYDLRKYIKDQLIENYAVVEAEDGIKGLQIAEEILPDLIISDIMMPKMDGYALCKKIKNIEKTDHIPVILLTAKAELQNKLDGLETGADDYLIKPFNTSELKTRVKNLITLRRQMREKFRSEMILKPSEIVASSSQQNFIKKLTKIIEENLSNEKFGIESLCSDIGMSRAQLHRKIKAVTNQSTSEFIRTFRLQRAADLIKQDAGNMAEVAYKVGFGSQAYFTKSFIEEFGCTPTDYKRNKLN